MIDTYIVPPFEVRDGNFVDDRLMPICSVNDVEEFLRIVNGLLDIDTFVLRNGFVESVLFIPYCSSSDPERIVHYANLEIQKNDNSST